MSSVPSFSLSDCSPSCRYLNVDYAFASAVSRELAAGIPRVVVTYDIACQWGKNLRQRLSQYTATKNINLGSLQSLRFAVPKFHLIGHGKSCNLDYNLAFIRGVGMTHGESVETIWSHSTSLATWSRENGPHARHALLDTHWSGWNWRKLIHLREPLRCRVPSTSLTTPPRTGPQLEKNLEKAWKSAKDQNNILTTLTNSLNPTLIKTWTAMMDTYYLDSSKPNPFEEPVLSEYVFVALFFVLMNVRCHSQRPQG